MSALDELAPASFRGVPFHVSKEKTRQRRSVPVHEYAGTDHWSPEDMGLRPYAASVTAYVARIEGVQAQSYALWNACTGSGAATLVLPHAGSRQMWCIDIERAQDKDHLGLVAFDLEFVAVAPGQVGVSPMQAVSSAASIASAIVGAVAGMVRGSVR